MASENGGPGLVEKLRTIASAGVNSRYARAQESQAMARQAEALADRIEESVRRVRDTNTWIPVDGDFRQLTQSDRSELRERAQRAALRSPLIVGYLNTMKRFVMGEGPEIRAATEDDSLNETLDDWWGRVEKINRWSTLEDEIVVRTWRDGEAFIHEQVQPITGPIEDWEPDQEVARRLRKMGVDTRDLNPPDIEAGMTFFRLRPPSRIADPKGKIQDGIVTASADSQTVLGYVWNRERDTEFIPAGDMRHIKIRADSDMLRGRSQLEPLLKRNKQYEDWLEYRILLNLARTAVVLVKKFDRANQGDISAIRDQQKDERGPVGSNRKQKMMEPLSTIHSSGIEYEFKSPNLQARDAQKDGRRIQLDMAASMGIAEFIFTGDASNANFASTLVAESPTMREFQSWRDFFTPHFRALYRDAIRNAAEVGSLDINPEQVDELPVAVDWPNMEMREELEHAKAQQIRHGAGILSKETWAREAGIDWEQEQERIEQEMTDMFDFTPPPAPDADDDDEDEDE